MLTFYSNKAGAAHIAFDAPPRAAVDDFFATALKAGGKIHDGPAVRDDETGYYSAAVIDIDGNAVECVYRDCDKHTSAASTVRDQSVVSSPSRTPEKAGFSSESKRSPLRTIVNNIITTTTTTLSPSPAPLPAPPTSGSNDTTKALVGVLLGAAAGAAFAFALVKSEEPDPSDTQPSHSMYQRIEAPPTPPSTISVHSTRSRPHVGSECSSPRSSRRTHIRMIEAPPSPPSEVSSQRTIKAPSMRAIEVPPAFSAVSHKSRSSHAPTRIPHTLPSGRTSRTVHDIDIESARSYASRSSRASGHTRARSVVTNSRVPIDIPLLRSPDPSIILRTPSDFPLPKSAYDLPVPFKSKPSRRLSVTTSQPPENIPLPSSHTSHASRIASISSRHSHSKSRFSRAPEDYALPPSTKTSAVNSYKSARSSNPSARALKSYPLPPSAKTSFVSRPPSLSRSAISASTVRVVRPRIEKAATDVDDMESLCPSDSISQVSSKGRRRRHRTVGSTGGRGNTRD